MITDQNNCSQQEQLKNFLLKNSSTLGFDVQNLISIERIIHVIASNIELNMQFGAIIFPDKEIDSVSLTRISQVIRNFFLSEFSKNFFCVYKIDAICGYNLKIGIYKPDFDAKAILDDYDLQHQEFKKIVLSIFATNPTPLALKDFITQLEYILNNDPKLKVSLKNVLLKLSAKSANLEDKVCLMPGDIVRYLRKIDGLEQVGAEYKNVSFRLIAPVPILYSDQKLPASRVHTPYQDALFDEQKDLCKAIASRLYF